MSIKNLTVDGSNYDLYAKNLVVEDNLVADVATVTTLATEAVNVTPLNITFNFSAGSALGGQSFNGVFLTKYGDVVFMTFDQSTQYTATATETIECPANTIPEIYLPPFELGDTTWVNIVLLVNTQPVLCPMRILDNGSFTIFNGYTNPIGNATFDGGDQIKFAQNGVCWGTTNV